MQLVPSHFSGILEVLDSLFTFFRNTEAHLRGP